MEIHILDGSAGHHGVSTAIHEWDEVDCSRRCLSDYPDEPCIHRAPRRPITRAETESEDGTGSNDRIVRGGNCRRLEPEHRDTIQSSLNWGFDDCSRCPDLGRDQ